MTVSNLITDVPAEKHHPSRPLVETFNPGSPVSMEALMPVGVLPFSGVAAPRHGYGMVGVPWDGNADHMISWNVNDDYSDRDQVAAAQMLTLAETERGFLLVDPSGQLANLVKPYLAGRHADRVVEIDLGATGL